jgi:hypothetical protein
MRFSLHTLIYLCLIALASALPGGGGGGGTPRVPPPPLVPNEDATWFCTHKYKVMYSWYVLNGSGWNKTEKEIRKVIENAGMTTRLSFKEVKDEDGVLGFESSVSSADFLFLLSFRYCGVCSGDVVEAFGARGTIAD